MLSLLKGEDKWKQLGSLAMAQCQFGLALECLHHAKDYSGLLLLATSAGDSGTVGKLAETTADMGKNNITFLSNFLLGRYTYNYSLVEGILRYYIFPLLHV